MFEAGSIKGLDPKLFNFTREELKEVDFVNIAYLIVHPKGTIMFDTGGVPDSAFKPGGAPVTEGIMSATKPLKPQLAAVGYKPSDITYLALSHYHSDHTANANDFAAATWIVQKAERDFMFADKPQGIIQPAQYSALQEREDDGAEQRGPRRVRRWERRDHVDAGSHAGPPGALRQTPEAWTCRAGRRPVSLPRGAATGRIPTFEFNAEQSAASRKKVESVHQAEQGRALDRARHRDAREAAEGAGVR